MKNYKESSEPDTIMLIIKQKYTSNLNIKDSHTMNHPFSEYISLEHYHKKKLLYPQLGVRHTLITPSEKTSSPS